VKVSQLIGELSQLLLVVGDVDVYQDGDLGNEPVSRVDVSVAGEQEFNRDGYPEIPSYGGSEPVAVVG
jgi:hypothetical protein